MNAGATAERVYDVLKKRIMAHEFRPGDRLDPALLAESLSSSVTPVRDALHILTGENLVSTRTGDGFHLPPIDEPGLVDLYTWTAEVLGLSIRAWKRSGTREVLQRPVGDNDILASRTAIIFQEVATHSTNVEHSQAISSSNARLHAVRMVESHILEDCPEELAAIEVALEAADANRLRPLLAAYHRRRRRRASEIVRAVYRAS